jgi:flagellar motor switch protein FliM
MTNITERILEYLKEAWQQIDILQPNILTFETNPQLVTIAPASETMLVLNFPIAARDHEFFLILCFPYFMLEPVLKKINSNSYMTLLKKETNEEDHKSLYRAVEQTNVNFTVELGRMMLSVDEFLELQENELIILDTIVSEPLTARVQQHKKCKVYPGKVGKHKAVIIDNLIDEEGDKIL